MIYYATRQYAFESAHSVSCSELNSQENEKIYGLENTNVHGHNFILQTTIAGTLNPKTSMVVDLGDLDEIVNSKIVDVWDHRNISILYPERPCSLENLTLLIWKILRPEIPLLNRITLYETSIRKCDYLGETQPEKLYLTHTYEFCAARQLFKEDFTLEKNKDIYGDASQEHGHNFQLEITLKNSLDWHGMIISPRKFDEDIKEIINKNFNYKNLNKQHFFQSSNKIPSTEILCEYIWNEIKWNEIKYKKALHKIRISETAETYFDYLGPDNE